MSNYLEINLIVQPNKVCPYSFVNSVSLLFFLRMFLPNFSNSFCLETRTPASILNDLVELKQDAEEVHEVSINLIKLEDPNVQDLGFV